MTPFDHRVDEREIRSSVFTVVHQFPGSFFVLQELTPSKTIREIQMVNITSY